MKNNNYCVYMHVTPDGKRYIGITGQKAEKRWRDGDGYKGYVEEFDSRFYREAITRFGWDNIEHRILHEGLTKDEAYTLEERYIRAYHTYLPSLGFNDCVTKGQRGSSKPVRCIDLHMVFPSIRECAEYIDGATQSGVSNACYSGSAHKGHYYEFAYTHRKTDVFPND